MCFASVIEFQKRGLPHAHILLKLKTRDVMQNPDQFVSAELPDQADHAQLYQCVTDHMIHGPCGALKPNSPCMKDNTGSKEFPKRFTANTTIPGDGFIQYQRRNDGRVFIKSNVAVDNRWVVPYNPYLLETLYLLIRFNCHMNVEICSTMKAVKYLYKYINKGEDRRATNRSANANDEIQIFLDCRYIVDFITMIDKLEVIRPRFKTEETVIWARQNLLLIRLGNHD